MPKGIHLENEKRRQKTVVKIDSKVKSSGCWWDKDTYINYHTKIVFKCGCGNIHKMTPAKILRYESKLMCPQCRVVNSRINISQEIKDRFKKDGAIVDFDEYRDMNIPLRFICKCGNIGEVKIHALLIYKNHRVHCKKCAKLYNLWINSGSRHPRYNPNLTDEDRRANKGRRLLNPFISYWYRAVKRKYNYTCVISGVKGDKNVVAHHLYNWARYPQYRVFLDNGVCLSKNIHNEFHIQYGKNNNTFEQFSNFYYNRIGDIFKGVNVGRN